MGAITSRDIISRFYKGKNELIDIDVKKSLNRNIFSN